VGDPHTKTTPSFLGAGKEWSRCVCAWCHMRTVRANRTDSALFLSSLELEQQARKERASVCSRVAVVTCSVDDIAHVLGQRQQCRSRSEKHRENRRSAEYIFRRCQSCRSSLQAQGRHTIPLHHVRTPRRQRPRGSCFGFGHCASPNQRHFLSRLLC
jgi:hypothetical protein